MSPSYHEFLLHPIDQGRVVLLNRISRGSFGVVYNALGPIDPMEFKQPRRHDQTQARMEQLLRVYAVKSLHRSRRSAYDKEASCHQTVSACPGVVTLHHVVEEPDATYLVMDYHPEGNLCSSLSTNLSAYNDVQHAKRISLQLLTAVQQCHDLKVFHRDLKPDNVLLADGGTRVVLSDFGLSTRLEQSVDFGCGSEVYMSPECLGDLHCTTPYRSAPSDVWSLGVIIFCIFFGVPPWSKPSSACASFNSFLMDPDFFLRRYPISAEFHRLLVGVFTVDPRRRTKLSEFISNISAIDPSNFTYRSDPGRLFATRAKSLRSIGTELIQAHVEKELSTVLDTRRFLRERGLDDTIGSSERDHHFIKFSVKPRAKLPSYVCSFESPYLVGNWVSFCIPSHIRPPMILDTSPTPTSATEPERGGPTFCDQAASMSSRSTSICDTLSSFSNLSYGSNATSFTPQSATRGSLEDCGGSSPMHEELW